MNEKLLLIDSVSQTLFVALISGEVVDFREFKGAREHDKNLNPLVKELLSATKTSFSGITAIAVVNGPGSWTGTRVGITAAKAYSIAHGIPVISLTADDDRNKLIDNAKKLFTQKQFITARELSPYYDSEFKVTTQPQKR